MTTIFNSVFSVQASILLAVIFVWVAGGSELKHRLGMSCERKRVYHPKYPDTPEHGGWANGQLCGTPMSMCTSDTNICDCFSPRRKAPGPKDWMRTYEDGECRLLPGSRCLSNEAALTFPEFQRCVKNAKCISNGPMDETSICPADSFCEVGDGNCVCDEGKTCLDKRMRVPRANKMPIY